MPNYPSNFSNTSPFSKGPLSNTNLLYDIRNKLARHNLISVHRIIDTNFTMLNPVQYAWMLSPPSILTGHVYQVSGPGLPNYAAQIGIWDSEIVVLTNQTDPSQNGVFKYSAGGDPSTNNGIPFGIPGMPSYGMTGSSGPCFIRVQALSNLSGSFSTSGPLDQAFLNTLWNPTSWFGYTGSQQFSGSMPGGYNLLDQAGVGYPQGFIATSGSTADSADSLSNRTNVVYYAQEDVVTPGTTAIRFSTVNDITPLLPSSNTTAGTDRLGYASSTVNDFYVTAKVMATLLGYIAEFRESGGATDLSATKRAYLANLSAEKLDRLQAQMEGMLDDLYQMYYLMWNLAYMYNTTTGPKYPSEYNRGYSVFRNNA